MHPLIEVIKIVPVQQLRMIHQIPNRAILIEVGVGTMQQNMIQDPEYCQIIQLLIQVTTIVGINHPPVIAIITLQNAP